MKKIMTSNYIVKPLALALMLGSAYLPFVHAEQDALGQLYNAITYENVPKAKAALAAGVDWTQDGKITDHQWATIHFAVRHTSSNGVEILKLLLAGKADVNARAEYRNTPLHLAAEGGYTNAVRLLIERKADVNAQLRDLKTPLHLAASNGHVDTVKLLVDGGALINAKDRYKNTPLMCAVVAKHKEVETFLRQQGAKAR
jgi:hypothetical protein